MTIVIPMSGDGVRFKQAGYAELKSFIEVDGKPMIEHVLQCFPGETNIVFICQAKHLAHRPYRETFRRIAPSATIVAIPQKVPGPVPAVLAADHAIPDDEPVIVNYCDFSVGWDYADFKARFLAGAYDGAVTTYTGFHPHLLGPGLYAGVLANERGEMTAIQEKHSFTVDKMASRHSTGLYAFRTGGLLKQYCQEVMNRGLRIRDEYYASLLYIPMLEDQRRILVYDVPYFLQWGTPQDLEEYQYWLRYFAKKTCAGSPLTNTSMLEPRIHADHHAPH